MHTQTDGAALLAGQSHSGDHKEHPVALQAVHEQNQRPVVAAEACVHAHLGERAGCPVHHRCLGVLDTVQLNALPLGKSTQFAGHLAVRVGQARAGKGVGVGGGVLELCVQTLKRLGLRLGVTKRRGLRGHGGRVLTTCRPPRGEDRKTEDQVEQRQRAHTGVVQVDKRDQSARPIGEVLRRHRSAKVHRFTALLTAGREAGVDGTVAGSVFARSGSGL